MNKLRRLDLTLLLVFLGLLNRRRAVTVAGELGLTQSAVSHALKRLREVFDDPLFLRRPHGLEPTAVALELEDNVRAAVDSLSAALAGPRRFVAEQAAQTVRIGAFDGQLATLMPDLVHLVRAAAPGLRLSAVATARSEALAALAAGELDFALGYYTDLDERFEATLLYAEDYLVVGRKDAAVMRQRLTLRRFLAAEHVLVSPVGELSGVVDEALARHDERREVIAAMPLFLPALAVVAATGAIATVPARLALAYARRFDLVTAPPPLELRRFTISAVRHKRNARSALHDWMLDRMREICTAQEPGSAAVMAARTPSR